ncbi:hypothetical protein [Pirellulimonas nuda]|nr:hypothetical protein [Pirellulimonas nuda]
MATTPWTIWVGIACGVGPGRFRSPSRGGRCQLDGATPTSRSTAV